jgi:hypothetical protein
MRNAISFHQRTSVHGEEPYRTGGDPVTKNKMTAKDESIVCMPAAFNREINRNQSVNCHLCEELNLELQRAQQELLSYAKVIEILRNELANAAQRDHCAGPDTIKQSTL